MKQSIVTLLAAAALTSLACNNEAETPAKPGVPAGALELREPLESEGDREIAASVRRGVAADDQLSVSAKQVRISCRSGTVTLRGPVLNADERARVAGYARRVAGVQDVNDFLEVALR